MSTKPCVFCGTPTPQVEGRKPRKYCSDTCRQKDWQARNKSKAPIKTKEKTTAKDGEDSKIEMAESQPIDKDTIEKQISSIKDEKIPKHRDTPLGRKSWAIEQKKRIEDLQNKMNGVRL